MKHRIYYLVSKSLKEVFKDDAPGIALAITQHKIGYPKPEFGDYASNVALTVAKAYPQLAVKGAQNLAQRLALAMQGLDAQNEFETIEAIAGFINFKISSSFLLSRLKDIINLQDRYGGSNIGEGKTIVVEYFQNNVAKPPHVGHLRSAVVGDAINRTLKILGFNTISDTHIGDWGVQFGILLYAFKSMGKPEIVEKDPVNELNKLYIEMSKEIEKDPALREKGRQEFKKLEAGDKENRELWQWFVDESLKDFERYRKLLGLLPFDHNLGESFYEDKMPAVLEELNSKGLIKTGETGEQYVDLEEHGLGRCILVKSDGATTYHLRDFATYLYRKEKFQFDKNLYIVDNRQSHHFKQLFRVLELAGYPAEKDSAHLDVGFMSLPEGPISTRKGNAISLENLISEATSRSLAIIEEKNSELKSKQEIAREVALGAIKYFDLSHNRKTEFIFTWDKALSFEGNTGPYLQYTHARIHGILRKNGAWSMEHGVTLQALNYNPQPVELNVLRKLQQYPEVVESVIDEYLPNILCNYLFELAQSFNSFYQAAPVLQETDEKIKDFRLQLIMATAQVLKNGLSVLGIEAPQEM